jgi:hypothetical protein
VLPVNRERQLVGETQLQTGHLACGPIHQALNPQATPFWWDVEIHPERSRYLAIQKPGHGRYECIVTYDLVAAVKDDQTILVAPMMPEAVVTQKVTMLF